MSLYLGENLISGSKPINLGVRNIGEIVASPLPLTDAGLHLLDGSLILGGGIYDGFVDYIADLYTDNPSANYFTTEALWQTSVTTYGVCGKFVYDSVNNTVRLPKVTGIIEGTTDVTALGDLVEAGLPNITGRTSSLITSTTTGEAQGALYDKDGTITGTNVSPGSGYAGIRWYFDASRSNSIYGNSSTVQPQTIKAFYYIVIANSTKTDIQVDIDEVVTDLNGKADVDLTNTTNTGYIKMAGASMPSSTWITLTAGASDSTYIAPADGYVQWSVRPSVAGILIGLSNNTGHLGTYLTCVNAGFQYATYMPVKKGQTFSIYYSSGLSESNLYFTYAAGSESEAS